MVAKRGLKSPKKQSSNNDDKLGAGSNTITDIPTSNLLPINFTTTADTDTEAHFTTMVSAFELQTNHTLTDPIKRIYAHHQNKIPFQTLSCAHQVRTTELHAASNPIGKHVSRTVTLITDALLM